MTRFTILSYIRRDHIDQLPLPKITINYLLEKQCYVESLEDFEEAVRERPPLEFRSRSAMVDFNSHLTLQELNNNNNNNSYNNNNNSNGLSRFSNNSSSTSERSNDSHLATVGHMN